MKIIYKPSPSWMLLRLATYFIVFIGFAMAAVILQSICPDDAGLWVGISVYAMAVVSGIGGAAWVGSSIVNAPRCFRLISGKEGADRRIVSAVQGVLGVVLGIGLLAFCLIYCLFSVSS